MNAAFQTVFNDPVLREGLEMSTPLWVKRYEALDKLCQYFNNEKRDLIPWQETSDSALMPYNFIPSVLALLAHDDFINLRSCLLKDVPDLKISFETLIDRIQNKEPFDPYCLFQDAVQLQRTLDYFHTIKDIILDAARFHEPKKNAFYLLSTILKQCHEDDHANLDICLENLRPLMPHHFQRGQQDAVDFIDVLINRIIESGVQSNFLFETTLERHYVRAAMSEEKEARILETKRDSSRLPPEGIFRRTAKTFTFILPIKTKDNLTGQELLDQSLTMNPPQEKSDQSSFIDENNEPHLYEIVKEQITLEKMPDRFCISLSRGIGTVKNTAPVSMPETLKIDESTYQMESVGIHGGSAFGGHYRSFVRKIKDGQELWWHCNDDRITKATSDELEKAFTQGSFYFFTKKTSQ